MPSMYHSLLIFVAAAVCVNAMPITEILQARSPVDFFDPRKLGGSLLDKSAGLGEPLNVIISGLSSPEVLTPAGFLNYAAAVGFSDGCLGITIDTKQQADLGDGHGLVDEMAVFREAFDDPILGSCWEVLTGGNHFRVWKQDGPTANSGALFLAVSEEENLENNHNIVPDGYNIGRDKFVQGAIGKHQFLLKSYNTTVQDISDLLERGSQGVNHGISQDGIIKLLTVTIL